MKYIGTDTIMGIPMKHYKSGALTIMESIDDFDNTADLYQNFGTFRMPLGKYKHISISRIDRYPDWNEIKRVKDELFGDTFAFQMLPPKSHYTNVHQFCFHLWQILDSKIEL